MSIWLKCTKVSFWYFLNLWTPFTFNILIIILINFLSMHFIRTWFPNLVLFDRLIQWDCCNVSYEKYGYSATVNGITVGFIIARILAPNVTRHAGLTRIFVKRNNVFEIVLIFYYLPIKSHLQFKSFWRTRFKYIRIK